MKNQALFTSRIAALSVLTILSFSCNPKSDTAQQTEELTEETIVPMVNDGNAGFDQPVDTNNAVKVQVNTTENLNWEAFKAQFHVADEIEDLPDNIAAGPWISTDDYEYRRVYRMENNTLWIQTFYKRSGTSNEVDPNVTPSALSLQEADRTGLGTVWNDMIERGLFLTDSLSNQP